MGVTELRDTKPVSMLNLEGRLTIDEDTCRSSNLVGRLSETDAQTIGSSVWDGYSHDKQSRMIWETRMTAAMDLTMHFMTTHGNTVNDFPPNDSVK